MVIDTERRLDGKPVAKSILHVELLLSKFVKLSQDGRSKHVFDLNFAGSFGIKEEKEFPDSCNNVKGIEGVLEVVQLREGGHQFKNVVFKILLFKVAVTAAVVQRYLNPCLKQINFPDDIVEKRDYFDSAVLVSLELEEGAGGEELAALWRQ